MLARKLKVFEAQIGFYDTVVAVPSRAAALRAWGVHQDLFQDGQARESDDPAAIKAATAAPGEVLRRPAEGGGAFEREPRQAPRLPPPRKIPTSRAAAASSKRAPKAPAPPTPDRGALTRAERALTRVVAAEAKRTAALEKRRTALEAELREARDRFAMRRREAEAAVAAARKAWRRAGGAD